MSNGNGHPYSWSAICNGYSAIEMQDCPFPAIPDYLSKRKFPEDRLEGVEVTHVWTQDISMSTHIAKAAMIAHISRDFHDMVGAVDGLLLARDDAENHEHFATPFLKAGLPILIDKPFALEVRTAERLISLENYPGQIFTGSGVAWAKEMSLTDGKFSELGPIRKIVGTTPKSWKRYGVHIVESGLKAARITDAPDQISAQDTPNGRLVQCQWHGHRCTAEFTATGAASPPISVSLIGEMGRVDLVFKDSFSAFRTMLQQFRDGVSNRERRFDYALTRTVTRIIEAGLAEKNEGI